MKMPPAFKDATGGFYAYAMSDDGMTPEDCLDMGVAGVWHSRFPELVAYVDELLAADDATIEDAWMHSGASFMLADMNHTRQLLRRMRDYAVEAIRTGKGGLPG